MKASEMPTYEVHGPDPDGDFFIVCIETKGEVHSETSLDEVYATREDAQAAVDELTAASDDKRQPRL